MGNFQETIAVNRDLLSLKRVITGMQLVPVQSQLME